MSILPFSEEELDKSALKAFTENNDLKAQLFFAEQTIKEKDEEIERRTELIEKAWIGGRYDGRHNEGDQHEQAWQQFQTENNL